MDDIEDNKEQLPKMEEQNGEAEVMEKETGSRRKERNQ